MTTLRLSTRLGLIACRYLAKAHQQGVWVTAPEMAAYYNMNVRALMPALRGLVRAGILRSQVGGRTPGFAFAKSPDQVMLLDVMNALEDQIVVSCCKDLVPGLRCDCGGSSECKLHALFFELINNAHERCGKTSVASYAE